MMPVIPIPGIAASAAPNGTTDRCPPCQILPCRQGLFHGWLHLLGGRRRVALDTPLVGLFRVHGGAIDFCPSQVDGGDSPCVGDVVQGVCLKDQEVRTLPDFDGARIGEAQQVG